MPYNFIASFLENISKVVKTAKYNSSCVLYRKNAELLEVNFVYSLKSYNVFG